jgi:hypothetical protein
MEGESNICSSSVQRDDDDVKTSEPVAEGTGKFVQLKNDSRSFFVYLKAIANQINWTTVKILGQSENKTSSISNPVDQQFATTTISSRISEVTPTVVSDDVRLHSSPPTRIIMI